MTSYAVEDDALLAWATSHAIIAVETDDAHLADALRPVVQHVTSSRRRDGSWPPAELVQEALAAALEIAADRVAEADLAADPDEAPWLEAWRQCARHLPTLDAVLGDLRAGLEADAQVVPRLYLLDDLEQLPPPSA